MKTITMILTVGPDLMTRIDALLDHLGDPRVVDVCDDGQDYRPHKGHTLEIKGHTWEIDTTCAGLNQWLTLIYDHDADIVLAEYMDPQPPTGDRMIGMLGETLARQPHPERCIFGCRRDRLGRLHDYLSTYGIRAVYASTHRPRRRPLERIFHNRQRAGNAV